MWKLLWRWGGRCGKTSSAIADVLLKKRGSCEPELSTGGSHLGACVFEVWGEGQQRRDASLFHAPPWLAALRLRGPGWGVVGERDRGGMTIWLSSSMYTHTHTPLSNTLSHTLRQTSPWLFTVLALIWAVTALTALVEEADWLLSWN